jgi:hypothetical protein
MPHLVMLDFQLVTMAFLTRSTLARQANEAQEVNKEMEINSRRANINVNTNIQEEPCR